MSNIYKHKKDIGKLKLYRYKKDVTRKIVEEENTIYEVDNKCIIKNRNKKN